MMKENKSPQKPKNPYEQATRQGDRLVQELDSVTGAQKLGDDAYETAKQDLAKKEIKP